MPATKRGIYHNLKESKYTISNGEIVFFFSSEVYLEKFIDRYKENREIYWNRFKKKKETELNFDILYDIFLYKEIEKRGFRALLKGYEIDYSALEYYALGKMTDNASPEWERIEAPSPRKRVSQMMEDRVK